MSLAALSSVIGKPDSNHRSDQRPSPGDDVAIARPREAKRRLGCSFAGGACHLAAVGLTPPFPGMLAGYFPTRPQSLTSVNSAAAVDMYNMEVVD